MRSYFTSILLLILFLFPLFPVLAEEPVFLHIVAGDTKTLDGSAGALVFSGIKVEPGGTLIIKPNSVIEIADQGTVIIDGKLEANGTTTQPITFTSYQHMWASFQSNLSAKLALNFLTFRNFSNGITIFNPGGQLHNITLLDGLENILIIGEAGLSLPTLQIEHIFFENHLAGNLMQHAKLLLTGTYLNLQMNDIHFQDSRLEAVRGVSQPYIENQAISHTGGFTNIYFPGGCTGNPKIIKQGGLMMLKVDTAPCAGKVTPILFVPGFATSLNPALITQLPGAIGGKNWYFLRPFTMAYAAFFQDLELSNIPYSIAFYDWRLPPDQAAKRYLIPKLEELKRATHSDTVYIVAHSYGGLVARAYIQSSDYQGDVQDLVQLGSPNQGVMQVYPLWEGAQIPSPWTMLDNLLKFYQYRWKIGDRLQAVHQFFPSVQALLPTFPGVFHNGQPVVKMYYQNKWLQDENDHIPDLMQRVSVLQYGNDQLDTPEKVDVTDAHPGEVYWPDGKLIGSVQTEQTGDGTTLWKSLQILGAYQEKVAASHPDLIALAAQSLLTRLYPGKTIYLYNPSVTAKSRIAVDSMLLFFDCPITVQVQSPSGIILKAQAQVETSQEVFVDTLSDPDLLIFALPKESGYYKVDVTALADTPVRYWLDGQEPQVFSLVSGEQRSFVIENVSKPLGAPLISSATAQPDQTIPEAALGPEPVQTIYPGAYKSPFTTPYSFSQPLIRQLPALQLLPATSRSTSPLQLQLINSDNEAPGSAIIILILGFVLSSIAGIVSISKICNHKDI